MKKVKLTAEEINSLKGIYELQKKANDYAQESKLKMAQFWYDFNKRVGPGAYSLNTKELCVMELDHEEQIKEQQNHKG